MIYLIQEEGDEQGPVKVGASENPYQRIKTLQTGNHRKLRILRLLQVNCNLTSRQMEQRLHKMLADSRIEGTKEWFSYDGITELFNA